MAQPVAAQNVRPSGMASYLKPQSPFRALAVIARRNDEAIQARPSSLFPTANTLPLNWIASSFLLAMTSGAGASSDAS